MSHTFLENLIAFFARRHLLTNAIMILVLAGGVFAWQATNKEELPDITFDFVRISVRYPGAPAEDVEYFVTKPIEEVLRGLDGVYRITSNSSVGSANISVELEQDYPRVDEAVTEIRNEVLGVDLPAEVIDDPSVRVFKTSKKAILDVALIHNDYHVLTSEGRRELQEYALALENQLLNLPEVNSVNRRGYLQQEIIVRVYPDRLRRYDIPFNSVMNEIKANHIRKPAGSVETEKEPKVTLLAELNSVEKLENLIVQGGFEGQVVKLGQVAKIEEGFEKNETIYKVNGREAVMFNVVKNSGYGILDSLDAVTRGVNRFRKNNLEGTPIEVVFLDDESIDVRNRLNIISVNGAIGFALILVSLFIFLNRRSAVWVAVGIPFTVCLTMLGAFVLGYTINGITLAAVIIVMGMIVDDAIVVAENITRVTAQGVPNEEAVIKGTSYVLLPIVASIATTCVSFIPLFFFTGRFGGFIQFIPPIIFLMLAASLIESIFILPGHLDLHLPFRKRGKGPAIPEMKAHWFEKMEEVYARALRKLLAHKVFVFVGFFLLFSLSAYILTAKMKFVMFPNEETRDVVLSGRTAPGTTRYQTAKKTLEIESLITPYIGKEVVGFRTEIARSRRGGPVEENYFRMIVEIVPSEKRDISADEFVELLQKEIDQLDGFQDVRFRKSRWGQESGSPIEIIVQQNNDQKRDAVLNLLTEKMRAYGPLKNVEIEENFRVPEYRVDIQREKLKRLSISPSDLSSTFRAALEGVVMYEFSNGDEDVYVRFTIVENEKDDIEKILNLPVENRGNYLVPLRSIVTVEEVESPSSIARRDLKRTSFVYADINQDQKKTPLEIAEYVEENIFPEILAAHPTTALSFGGEVQDTRESRADFKNAIMISLLLIYFILAVLFNSLWKPVVIMMAIPFGVVGVVLAFHLHGKDLFGFYAAVGALGLSGVVINDSIIMLVKLAKEFNLEGNKTEDYERIADIAKTRLRAVILTTLTTVAGLLPTAYGVGGSDAMLEDMMLAMSWGLVFGTLITLVLIPSVFGVEQNVRRFLKRRFG